MNIFIENENSQIEHLKNNSIKQMIKNKNK